jgi:SAM-dependent methyltransferase
MPARRMPPGRAPVSAQRASGHSLRERVSSALDRYPAFQIVTNETHELRRYWDKVADEIERRGGVVAGDDTPCFRYKREKFVRLFLDSMPIEERSVLEVGCGPGGNLAELMNRRPRRLVGCDISPNMVKLARRTGVEIVALDGSGLPFGDREFDFVYTVTVLQHNPEVGNLLENICRVSGEAVQLIEDVGPAAAGGNFFRRPVDQYSEICRACGFELVSVDALGTGVSKRLHDRLTTILDRRQRHEGEPVRASLRALERLLLPVTSRLDNQRTIQEDLTRMVFRRR